MFNVEDENIIWVGTQEALGLLWINSSHRFQSLVHLPDDKIVCEAKF